MNQMGKIEEVSKEHLLFFYAVRGKIPPCLYGYLPYNLYLCQIMDRKQNNQ